MPEARLRVAYLGPPGSHSDEALRASAPATAELDPRPTMLDAVMAVQRGEADRAVVPIENALEGGVSTTLDALAGDARDVRILNELIHPVHHHLLGREPVALERITHVVSHPQATGQCRRFLEDRLAGARHVAAESTSGAVRRLDEEGPTWAALGSRLAGELYARAVLAERVEDDPDNVTRFVWLGPEGAEGFPGSGPARTSIVFWGFNDLSPGALVSVLRELSDRDINLSRIESRPLRTGLGHYRFFADLDGRADDPVVGEALEALAQRVEVLRTLGSYPAADPAR